jgi:3'-phosphoadenosine 5'-phosphosulfate sulfotransferase (PAPS reductase)/FAD synthetase
MRTITEYLFYDEQARPVDIVVPISGGKDSQACMKLACELRDAAGLHVIGLFCDTKFEHPWTYEHVKHIEQLYSVQILQAESTSVETEVLKYKRFPGGGARHCTSYLKIRIGKMFYKALAEMQGCGFEVWYGVRGNESAERSKRYANRVSEEVMAPHEFMPSNYPQYLGKMGVRIRLPVLEWTTEDVKAYIGDEDLNPLYSHGFDRVGCFPCLAGGDAWKVKAFEFDDFGKEQYVKVKDIEKRIGKSVFTSGVGKRWEEGKVAQSDQQDEACDSGSGCSFCAM